MRGELSYDLVIIGGGIAGCALGRAMALNGAEVLIIEKEARYRDRIRGEVLLPWGSLEARELGIYDILLRSCAREAPYELFFLAGEPAPPRHFPTSTPGGACGTAPIRMRRSWKRCGFALPGFPRRTMSWPTVARRIAGGMFSEESDESDH
jgi:2-polyprenyl-6-methoxyphenol hydroxylase-like FAD-dependent oxidoreductase